MPPRRAMASVPSSLTPKCLRASQASSRCLPPLGVADDPAPHGHGAGLARGLPRQGPGPDLHVGVVLEHVPQVHRDQGADADAPGAEEGHALHGDRLLEGLHPVVVQALGPVRHPLHGALDAGVGEGQLVLGLVVEGPPMAYDQPWVELPMP